MNYQPICKDAIEAVKITGEFIRKEYYTCSSHHIEYKGLNNLVSYVDKTAEKQLVDALYKILPEAGFIAEEETNSTVGEEYNWIIDPLDGTTNFIHGVPMFAISVALVKNKKPVIGIVYEIVRDECFYATIDGKAYCNEKEINVSECNVLNQTLLATGFPYCDFEKMEQYIELLKHLMKNCHGLRRMGSAAIDLVYVACGRFDSFFEYNLNSWDVAGGALIVERAGGKVSDFSGTDNYVFGREILATNGHIHNDILTICKQYF
jgi:myo-inositol-1(or 4)-monophosphatase